MSTNNVDFVYRNPRPVLTVEHTGGALLGACYRAMYFKVTSTEMLSADRLRKLFDAGFLGYGQEFQVKSRCDGKEKEAGVDLVPCSMVDRRTREVIPGEAINPYSGKPYAPASHPYWIYEVETRVDSSG